MEDACLGLFIFTFFCGLSMVWCTEIVKKYSMTSVVIAAQCHAQSLIERLKQGKQCPASCVEDRFLITVARHELRVVSQNGLRIACPDDCCEVMSVSVALVANPQKLLIQLLCGRQR